MKTNSTAANEDALLILGIQNADRQSLSKLYDKYAPALNGIICKIVGEETIAAEILQQTFQLAWHKIKSPDFLQTSIFTGLLQIARRIAIEGIKQQQLQNPAATDLVYVPDDGNIVQNSFSATYQKPIFELLYFKGLGYEEVAARLKIPIEEVKKHFRLYIKNGVIVNVI